MTWLFYAIFTIMCWGLHYNSANQTLKVASPLFIFWLPVIPLVLALPFYWRTLIGDVQAVYAAPHLTKYAFFSMFASICGTLSLFKAIQLSGNPTLVGLIEITYPLSIAIFAYFMFQENVMTWSMALGGSLILIGSAIVVYFNG